MLQISESPVNLYYFCCIFFKGAGGAGLFSVFASMKNTGEHGNLIIRSDVQSEKERPLWIINNYLMRSVKSVENIYLRSPKDFFPKEKKLGRKYLLNYWVHE